MVFFQQFIALLIIYKRNNRAHVRIVILAGYINISIGLQESTSQNIKLRKYKYMPSHNKSTQGPFHIIVHCLPTALKKLYALIIET